MISTIIALWGLSGVIRLVSSLYKRYSDMYDYDGIFAKDIFYELIICLSFGPFSYILTTGFSALYLRGKKQMKKPDHNYV
jgi:hypothetical protein